jgi:hypothetical protein
MGAAIAASLLRASHEVTVWNRSPDKAAPLLKLGTVSAAQREKLERLCRYVSRPPVASERLPLTASGQVRYTLKTPYRDGTTRLVLERAAAGGAGAAGAVEPAVNWRMSSDCVSGRGSRTGSACPGYRDRQCGRPAGGEAR